MLVLANEMFDSPPVFAWVLPVFVRLQPGKEETFSPVCVANRAAYPDPPPVVPHPESIDAQAAYRGRHSTIAYHVLLVVDSHTIPTIRIMNRRRDQYLQ
jgi:hypothetical protein